VKKHILIYGLLGGVLITLLKVIEYRYLVIEHSIEIYGGLVAAVFADRLSALDADEEFKEGE